MGLTYADAVKYVNKATYEMKTFRNFAVSDFWSFRGQTKDVATLDEYQKTWALYAKWKALCSANPSTWSSANGTRFRGNDNTRKFRYSKGTSTDIEPILGEGSDEVKLEGVGQCEYFAMQAFQALKIGGPTGTVPRVDKVSTPGHNWVVVNYSTDHSTMPNWIAVDYWYFALGAPKNKSICKFDGFAFGKIDSLEFVETFNPDKQT